MKKFACILGIGLLLGGCIKEQEPPKELLDEATMVKLLLETHELEATISDNPDLSKVAAKNGFEDQRFELFQQEGVDTAHFSISFDYYLTKPKELKGIYSAVVDSLRARKDFYSQY